MRPFLLALVLAGLFAAPAQAQFQSSNVSLLGKLPQSAGAIGARFSPDGDTMYVSSATGLQVYDVSTAATPRQLAQLAAAALRERGRRRRARHGRHHQRPVVQRRRRDLPDRRLRPGEPGAALACCRRPHADRQRAHRELHRRAATTCTRPAPPKGLAVYDIRDLDAPVFVKTIPLPGDGFTHDVHIDAAGIAWVTGEDGTFGYDVTDPLNPVAALPLRSVDRQHRRRAAGPGRLGAARLPAPQHAADVDRRWTKRARSRAPRRPAPATCWRSPRRTTRSRRARARARSRRGGSRTSATPDGTIKLELLDMWTTELNELANQTGRSPATGNCSAHWFDEQRRAGRPGLVRPGRALPRHLQPARHQAGRLLRDDRDVLGGVLRAATATTVYALDTTSGIDVLHVDRGDAQRSRAVPVSTADLLAGTRR